MGKNDAKNIQFHDELESRLEQNPYLVRRNLTIRRTDNVLLLLQQNRNIFQLDYLTSVINRQVDDFVNDRVRKSNGRFFGADYDARGDDEIIANYDEQDNVDEWGDPVVSDEFNRTIVRSKDYTKAKRRDETDDRIDDCIISNLEKINDQNFEIQKKTWKNCPNWRFIDYDPFRLTFLCANMNNLTTVSELREIVRLTVVYLYILTFRLEQILFVSRKQTDTSDDEYNNDYNVDRENNVIANSKARRKVENENRAKKRKYDDEYDDIENEKRIKRQGEKRRYDEEREYDDENTPAKRRRQNEEMNIMERLRETGKRRRDSNDYGDLDETEEEDVRRNNALDEDGDTVMGGNDTSRQERKRKKIKRMSVDEPSAQMFYGDYFVQDIEDIYNRIKRETITKETASSDLREDIRKLENTLRKHIARTDDSGVNDASGRSVEE